MTPPTGRLSPFPRRESRWGRASTSQSSCVSPTSVSRALRSGEPPSRKAPSYRGRSPPKNPHGVPWEVRLKRELALTSAPRGIRSEEPSAAMGRNLPARVRPRPSTVRALARRSLRALLQSCPRRPVPLAQHLSLSHAPSGSPHGSFYSGSPASRPAPCSGGQQNLSTPEPLLRLPPSSSSRWPSRQRLLPYPSTCAVTPGVPPRGGPSLP